MIGVAILWVSVSGTAASAALAIAISGETIEGLVLVWALRATKHGRPFDRLHAIATCAGALQAMSLSACVLLLAILAPGASERLIALIFLMAAAVNAGFALTHAPTVSKVKLGMFASCALIALVWQVHSVRGAPVSTAMAILEVAVLSYLVYTFVSFVVRAWRRRIENEHALLKGAEALDKTVRDLRASQEEAQRLALVASQANDSVIETDPARRITWVNRAFTEITGYSLEEALGKRPEDLLDGPDTNPEVSHAFTQAVRLATPHRAEVMNYRKDGSQLWMDVNLVPIAGADGKVERVVSIERDVTEMRRQAEALAEARDKAEAAARAKASFLAHMSHEIRTPLDAIIGMADLLTEAGLSEQHHEEAMTIRNASEALLKIINDILDLSRLGADKLMMDPQSFAPASCLREVMTMMRPLAQEKGLRLDMTHETQLPDKAVADAGRLRQVLVNLLGNAIKFTERGTVSVTASVRPHGDGWILQVIVRDSDVGVPPERAAAIFEEFEQGDADTTRRFGGTGLGLPISRALARRMGGDIVLIEPEGPDATGATFSLTVRLAPDRRGITPETKAAASTSALPRLHILLAEDNATNRLLVARFLQDEAVTLTMVENGRRAIEILSETSPDVVLMDMAMPEMDGLAATRAIRASDGPQPRIIALTANASADDRAACLSAGMDDFLSKPLRKPELLAALARAAGGQKGLSPSGGDTVSRPGTRDEASKWISPPASGTTSGRSIRSSGR
ncbi:response regulator [Allosediminivita pacifica]|uniref:response regulator n=1 Tax=Allosediminivita pacifica TaxID=1267769 RepID=UPI0019B7EE0B|nr:response regulator [Allosediminivita pacifica]GGA98946.1 hypothetical protein GCM10011324_06510 [Allosediminivita pacifica]